MSAVTPEKDFPGNRFLEEMLHLYKIADVMLVILEDKPYANMTIPGKVEFSIHYSRLND